MRMYGLYYIIVYFRQTTGLPHLELIISYLFMFTSIVILLHSIPANLLFSSGFSAMSCGEIRSLASGKFDVQVTVHRDKFL